MIIGVTGLIGSGKSEVAREFALQGADLIDADEIGREVVETDQTVLYRLVLEFGDSILDSDGKLKRRQLGRIAFSDRNNKDLLNGIIHPPLLKLLDDRLNASGKKHKHTIIDAALLIYWGYHNKIDCTVLVHASKKIRLARLQKKGLTEAEFNQRTTSQLSLAELKGGSDSIILNDGTLRKLREKSVKLYRQITENG